MTRFTRFNLTGAIQGVGFRPCIYNACVQANLSGFIQNTGEGVVIVVDNASAFQDILSTLPPHIRIDSIRTETTEEYHTGFIIRASTGEGYVEIPPDLFLCDDCLTELTDPENRRLGYFFLTCTLCGPRFTIAESSPYDRATTTMRDFTMCPNCQKEYTDPSDRRFHAQTIACSNCGPRLTLYKYGEPLDLPDDTDKLRYISHAFQKDEIVAIKGVGGFHLFCNTQKKTIAKLDTLTGRHRKPYAVLCRDIVMARNIATLTPKEEEVLLSPERPIVLASKNTRSPDASELDTIGIMLASTALHILLFEHFPQPLICTSSNLAHAPLTIDRAEQLVPLVLDHDRRIIQAADDSILKIINRKPLLIRRSRGFVPRSIAIDSTDTAPILALGAEMNNTFAIYDGHGRVTLSQHIGDTTHPETFDRYRATIDRFLTSARITPRVLLCDAHPEYQTSLYGRELAETLNIP
ncbi:MAG: carbamoyltransferase HypF, partial [Candidatus Moranbacteria bacterium]|nr:carbamoyltransferase HypF [Candidatus Moranbacteria bacterium]